MLILILLLALFVLAVPSSPGRPGPECSGRPATIVSNAARVVGTKAPDVIVAAGRGNTIFGLGGNDSICAGAGEDTILGGRGSDDLEGGRGQDQLRGESGNDTVAGGLGAHDEVDGGPGDDSLGGGPGDFDVLDGGPGKDRADGGRGLHDIASYQSAGGPIAVDLRRGVVSGAERERLAGAEDVLGGSGNDTLLASRRSINRLDGGPGADQLVAAGSGDTAFGGPGDDACLGPLLSHDSCGPSEDPNGAAVELYKSIADTASLVIVGGEDVVNVTVSRAGRRYVVRSRPGGVQVHLGDRGSRACSSDGAARFVSCHGRVASILASLGAGDDTLRIKHGVPAGVTAIVDAGDGSDHVRGGRGDDTIYAGDDQAPDTIAGGGGGDVLYGVNIFHPRRDSGAATLLGGAGNDLLVGGQPCDGDRFDGGPGATDSASFARVKNGGTVVRARIGGTVLDPSLASCNSGRISRATEKIEGSPGRDVLIGSRRANTLLGRGGSDRLDGRGRFDKCSGGRGGDRAGHCEVTTLVP
jgi:Ca2+-binding RTX toxin-like protein